MTNPHPVEGRQALADLLLEAEDEIYNPAIPGKPEGRCADLKRRLKEAAAALRQSEQHRGDEGDRLAPRETLGWAAADTPAPEPGEEELDDLLTRLDNAANCAVFLGVPNNTDPNHPEQLFLRSASRIRELRANLRSANQAREKAEDQATGWEKVARDGTEVYEARITELEAAQVVYEQALRQIDETLRIPAAEYVPAIGDVFNIIDGTKAALAHKTEGE